MHLAAFAGRALARPLLVALLAAATIPAASPARAATFTIACGDIAGLTAAINAANANGAPDTIDLAPGCTYTLTAVDNTTGGPNGLPVVTLDGGDAANSLTIDGNGATIERSAAASTPDFRFFHVVGPGLGVNPVLALNNLTLRNGSAGADDGGAILAVNADITLSDVSLTANAAAFDGGAIRGTRGTLTIARSTFSGNVASSGGAIYTHDTYFAISGSTFSGNTASTPFGRGGGAIYALNASGEISASLFSANVSAEAGGALSLGADGGGELLISNSTFSGNRAALSGGAIANSITLILEHLTVTANTADSDADNTGDGGGLESSDVIAVRNSIIAGNSDTSPAGGTRHPDVSGVVLSGGYNLVGDDTGADDGLGSNPFIEAGDQVGADPRLGPLADNGGPTLTHALRFGSQALDRGDPAFTPPPDYDQRGPGFARLSNGRLDIGAFEAQGPLPGPEIAVEAGATPVADGQTAPVSFGSTAVGAPVVVTFTVRNTGAGDLSLSGLTLPGGFSLVGAFPAGVPAGAAATFQVRLDAAAVGSFGGTLQFATDDADEHPFDFPIAGVVTATTGGVVPRFYLPLVLRPGAPDLAVTSVAIRPRKASYTAGEPVVVEVVVENRGSEVAGPFWVDLYVNPARPPQVNDLWHAVCGISPCVGVAWPVAGGLAPGGRITLTTAGEYDPARSFWTGWLPSGTTTVYAQADSWNTAGSLGAVVESDEANNRGVASDLAVTGPNPPYVPWPAVLRAAGRGDLPARPWPR